MDARTAYVTIVLLIIILYKKRNALIFIPALFIAFTLGFFLLSTNTISLTGFLVVIPETIKGLTITSFDRLIDLIFGQGLNTVSGRPVVGISEIHILNHFFTAGVFIYLLMFSIFFMIYYKYKPIILKFRFNVWFTEYFLF